MTPGFCADQAPVPPHPNHRAAASAHSALHLDGLTLVTRLHLLKICRAAVRLAQQPCPPPLPTGPGGAPRIYAEDSLLLLALLRTLWRLSYQELHDWSRAWPALRWRVGCRWGPIDDYACLARPAEQVATRGGSAIQ